jgi:hypothetical protein
MGMVSNKERMDSQLSLNPISLEYPFLVAMYWL